MRRTLLLILTTLLALPVSSVDAAEKWTEVQSRNFTLAGDASESAIREVAEGLEVFRTAFSRFFKVKEGSSVATRVIVFRSDAAFKPFKPVYKGKAANIAGFFVPGPDLNLIALAADMQTPRVIYHEYVHRLMADNMERQPLWFQEGFAEAFSTLEIIGRDKKVRLGRAIAEHVELLNERQFMPLEKLFSVVHGSPEYNEEEKQGVFYAESWALVHYMMFNDEQRRDRFIAFLGQVVTGKPAARAFEEIFGMELPAFQKTFEAYIQQRQAWNLFELPTPQGLDRNKDLKSRVMSEAEAESHLGDLLLRLDRLPEAETHLKKSIQLDPKLGAPQAAMGRLHMDKDNDAEALPYLRTATELDPDNYLTHYYYASLIRKQKDASETDRQSMRRALQRAIELKPEFVEATEMLAGDNLARNVDIPQTVEMLARAMAVAPSRAYLALQLAAALTRTQQREIARPLLHSLIASADLEPPLRQNAQSLLSFLDRAAAAENASRMAAEQSRLLAEQLARNSVPRTAAESENLEPPEIRRNVRDSSTDSPVAAPPPPPGLPDTIAPARREEPLAPGTARVRGMLTLLDCRNGLTLSVMVEGKTVKLHTATPGNIKFTSFNSSVSQSISCGPTSGNGVAATIVYRPRESDGSIGEPLSVDFVEAAGSARSQSVALPEIPGTATVKGLLTLLDCSNGVSVTLLSEGKTLRFYAERNTTIAFLNGPNADGTVTCGPMPGDGVPVVVLYRPSTAAGIQGEPLIVQFQR